MAEARKSKREEKKHENKVAAAARKLERKRKLDEMPEEELEAYLEQARVEREKKRKVMITHESPRHWERGASHSLGFSAVLALALFRLNADTRGTKGASQAGNHGWGENRPGL